MTAQPQLAHRHLSGAPFATGPQHFMHGKASRRRDTRGIPGCGSPPHRSMKIPESSEVAAIATRAGRHMPDADAGQPADTVMEHPAGAIGGQDSALRERRARITATPVTDRSHALADTLKNVFGYDSFRPLQQEIVDATLEGRDVLALLPTGGGKSLCYQLPALLRPGLTVVVSPLIALMKDQVDAMTATGVAATFLNSTLDEHESRTRLRELYEGKWRLLYLAPERLFAGTFAQRLMEWNLAAVAVDEAHCISEWGHDFRPEYRRLAELRRMLPDVPFLALTATATERVRTDILEQLRLREPATFIGSFNRANLVYRVVDKEKPSAQVLAFVRERPDDSGIVYCQSRKSCESLAEHLSRHGVAARPYHAGLSDRDRSRNQDAFLRDEVRVMCATIAFGMGVNKPNVRFVVHHDLPKNVEGYYQETGRAGRDGLPAECLLLFRASDVAKQIGFLEDISDPGQRRVAETQLRQMIEYAEQAGCRRSSLLAYFGERYGSTGCGSCDNCTDPRELRDGTIAAQKLLSQILRARAAGFRGDATFGLAHHAEVLTGGDTERIRRWGHEKLSTWGIGKEHSRPEWQAIGRELLRLGYVRSSAGEFPTIDITAEGVDVLRERRTVMLAQPAARAVASGKAGGSTSAKTPKGRAGEIVCDETLFEILRTLRRTIADSLSVPAYIVFGDVTLREMARDVPTSRAALSAITGVGEAKLERFGDAFLAAIQEYAASLPAG
jgi:ATP-dependent DNA helicase RecQ